MPNDAVRIFGAPPRYYQGPGALDRLPEITGNPTGGVLVIADGFVLRMLRPRLEALFAAAETETRLHGFDGEITYAAVAGVVEALDGFGPGIVVGLGGGKSLDAAKAVSARLGLPVVTVPTIASNDSPTSASIAMYDENHVMVSVDRLAASPVAVVVDTALIASAPARFLRAGIGDAVSKKFEAEGCLAGTGVTPFGTRPLRTGIAVGDACYATLRRHARAALEAVERGEVTEDVEAVVEATVLMSGLAFESGGLSLAHSLTRGLVQARDARNAIHGDHVAWGLLVQLAAENRDDAVIRDVMAFYREIGLPVSLGDLGMADVTDAEIGAMARLTMTAPHLANLPRPVDAAAVERAIRRSEALAAAA